MELIQADNVNNFITIIYKAVIKNYFSKKALQTLASRKYKRECRWRGKGCYLRALKYLRKDVGQSYVVRRYKMIEPGFYRKL